LKDDFKLQFATAIVAAIATTISTASATLFLQYKSLQRKLRNRKLIKNIV
jgi:hypothetical protein